MGVFSSKRPTQPAEHSELVPSVQGSFGPHDAERSDASNSVVARKKPFWKRRRKTAPEPDNESLSDIAPPPPLDPPPGDATNVTCDVPVGPSTFAGHYSCGSEANPFVAMAMQRVASAVGLPLSRHTFTLQKLGRLEVMTPRDYLRPTGVLGMQSANLLGSITLSGVLLLTAPSPGLCGRNDPLCRAGQSALYVPAVIRRYSLQSGSSSRDASTNNGINSCVARALAASLDTVSRRHFAIPPAVASWATRPVQQAGPSGQGSPRSVGTPAVDVVVNDGPVHIYCAYYLHAEADLADHLVGAGARDAFVASLPSLPILRSVAHRAASAFTEDDPSVPACGCPVIEWFGPHTRVDMLPHVAGAAPTPRPLWGLPGDLASTPLPRKVLRRVVRDGGALHGFRRNFVPLLSIEGIRRTGNAVIRQRAMRYLFHAVAHIHGHGGVHGDINKDTVLLGPDGTCHLIGVGCNSLAALSASDHSSVTIGFSAPEALTTYLDTGNVPLGTQEGDMWALGIICYTLLCGVEKGLFNLPAQKLSYRKLVQYQLREQMQLDYDVLSASLSPLLPSIRDRNVSIAEGALTMMLLSRDACLRPAAAQVVFSFCGAAQLPVKPVVFADDTVPIPCAAAAAASTITKLNALAGFKTAEDGDNAGDDSETAW